MKPLIMGAHAVHEVLKHAPHRIVKIFTMQNKQEWIEEGRRRKIPVELVSFDELCKMCESDSHQSVAATVKERSYFDAGSFLETVKDKSLVLMLDQIFDPQNFGALLRCAECLGADAAVWSKNRGCDITPTVVKASCGASELISLIRVSNLADAVDKFQKEGFEAIVTLADEKAESLATFRPSAKTLLILGSEGEGVQPLLRKKADRSVYIPMKGKIQSLNVAQAAAIILSHLC